jgi:hypothetical protein
LDVGHIERVFVDDLPASVGEPDCEGRTDMTIKSIFLFPNGMLAVCDHEGQQMGKYQGRATPELRAKIGRQLEKQGVEPEMHGCCRTDFSAAFKAEA